MSIKRVLQGSHKQECHLDQRSRGYEKIEKNLEKGAAGREIENGKNLVNDPMTSLGTVIIERIDTIEIVIGPETRTGTEIVAAIVNVLVIVIEVKTVVVTMIEIGIMDVPVIGIVIGTEIMKPGRQTMIAAILVIGIMSMITWMLNLTVAGMVKKNEVMIMLELRRIGGGMMLIKVGDNMMIKMIWVIMIDTIIMLMRVVIWKKMIIVMIGMSEEAEDLLKFGKKR